MHDLPTDWAALCAIVFLLGMRHGFDADHLAAIDGLTRLGAREQRAHARYCGALFSLGHGVVVVAIAAAVGLLDARWTPPQWLDALGAWISIGFLLLIGITNLRAALATPRGDVVALIGIKGRFLGRFMRARSPLGVAAVGFVFALSFDTVSQSALFAMTAASIGNLAHAIALGFVFVLGMLVADGLNGWWIARLMRRTDGMAAIASRVMSVAVSAVSLGVAALGIGKWFSPTLDGWTEGYGLLFGLGVVVVIAAGYLAACALARTRLGWQAPARSGRMTA